MGCKLIGILLVVICAQVHLIAGELLRAGIDVPEPKLLKKFEIPVKGKLSIFDESIVLDILIDKHGVVADVTERSYTSTTRVEAAKASVRQWQFCPTLVDGNAVPINER
jgi:hypothetical protein